MIKCDLLIKNTVVMTDYETVKTGMDIGIKGERILFVSEKGTEEVQAQKVIRGEGKLFMPGFTDSHMHTGQQLLKGQILDELPMIWTRIMLPFESTLTPERMRLSAGLAALEMMRSGTGAFIDAGSYHMEAAAEVYLSSGLRGILSASTMDQPGLPPSIAQNAEEAIAQTDRLYDGFHKNGLLKVAYSLRSLISCSPKLIDMAGERAVTRGTLLQAHMNEYPNEVNFFLQNHGCRPVEYLSSRGLLGPHFLGAHSILLSPGEEALLAASRSMVCHCPFSNCGKAVPDTPDLVNRGIIPGFGSDGAAHGGLSLWNEMRIFRSLMNIYHGVPKHNPKVMPAELLFRMMFEGGAAAVDEMGQCGRIEEGCKADMIGICLETARLIPSGNLIHTMFECGEAGDVSEMIVG